MSDTTTTAYNHYLQVRQQKSSPKKLKSKQNRSLHELQNDDIWQQIVKQTENQLLTQGNVSLPFIGVAWIQKQEELKILKYDNASSLNSNISTTDSPSTAVYAIHFLIDESIAPQIFKMKQPTLGRSAPSEPNTLDLRRISLDLGSVTKERIRLFLREFGRVLSQDIRKLSVRDQLSVILPNVGKLVFTATNYGARWEKDFLKKVKNTLRSEYMKSDEAKSNDMKLNEMKPDQLNSDQKSNVMNSNQKSNEMNSNQKSNHFNSEKQSHLQDLQMSKQSHSPILDGIRNGSTSPLKQRGRLTPIMDDQFSPESPPRTLSPIKSRNEPPRTLSPVKSPNEPPRTLSPIKSRNERPESRLLSTSLVSFPSRSSYRDEFDTSALSKSLPHDWEEQIRARKISEQKEIENEKKIREMTDVEVQIHNQAEKSKWNERRQREKLNMMENLSLAELHKNIRKKSDAVVECGDVFAKRRIAHPHFSKEEFQRDLLKQLEEKQQRLFDEMKDDLNHGRKEYKKLIRTNQNYRDQIFQDIQRKKLQQKQLLLQQMQEKQSQEKEIRDWEKNFRENPLVQGHDHEIATRTREWAKALQKEHIAEVKKKFDEQKRAIQEEQQREKQLVDYIAEKDREQKNETKQKLRQNQKAMKSYWDAQNSSGLRQ